MTVRAPDKAMSALQAALLRDTLAWLDRSRLPVGTQLRELPLAKMFGVSRTPMRAALRALEGLGYVEFAARRGFVLRRAAPVDGGADDGALPRSAHERLRDGIVADRAAGGLPAEVSEAELIARYGQSRGVVRRVMMVLSDDGLAQRLRGHGWRFSESLETRQATHESYEFRIAVECAALRQIEFSADNKEIVALRDAHERMLKAPETFDTRAWFAINSRFHEAVAVWSGNRFILDAVRRQNALRRLSEYRQYPELTPQKIESSLRDHLAMLDAIAAGELSWAESLMRRHLEMRARNHARQPDEARDEPDSA